jgi:hypothetical protein
MKKGPAILVLLTILITGAVFLLPKTEESSSEVMETEVSSEHDHSEGSGLFSVADSLVDDALNKLETLSA